MFFAAISEWRAAHTQRTRKSTWLTFEAINTYCTERKSLRNSKNEHIESSKLYHTQMKTDCDVYVNNTSREICKKIKNTGRHHFYMVSTKSSISGEHAPRTNSEVVIGPSV